MKRMFAHTVAATALAAAMTVSAMPMAAALPPGGPAPNTPGTVSKLNPSSVPQCGALKFSLEGFPKDAVVNIKFDDGKVPGADTSVQGTGVVKRVTVDAAGKISDSLDVPCDFPTGNHYLRFVGTAPDSKPFTHKSADFSVVAKQNQQQPPAGTKPKQDGSGGAMGIVVAIVALLGVLGGLAAMLPQLPNFPKLG